MLPNVAGGVGGTGSSSSVDAYSPIGVTAAPKRAIARINRAANCFFSV